MKATPVSLALAAASHCLLAACAATGRISLADDRAYEVSAAWLGDRPAVAWYGGRLAHEALFLALAGHGMTSGSPLQLTDATRDAFEPSLQGIDGDALVAWYEQDSGSQGGPRHQWALLARFDVSGREIWRRQLSQGGANGRIPVVRVAGGIIHAGWQEQRGDGVPMLRVASLDGAGNLLRAPRDAAVVGHETWNLNAAVSADGAFHVLFDAEQADHSKEIHWIRVQGDAVSHSQVSDSDGNASAYPDIAIDGSRFAVTWFDSRDGNEEIYLRCGQLDALAPAAGTRLDDANARRVTNTPTESIGAYVAWHQGHVELAWTEGSASHRALWRQQFDSDCQPMSAAKRISGHGTDAGIPSLSASPAGLILAWNGQRGDPAAPVHGRSRKPSSVVLLKVWPSRVISRSAAAR